MHSQVVQALSQNWTGVPDRTTHATQGFHAPLKKKLFQINALARPAWIGTQLDK
jgi:hypothetical protein